MAAFACIQVRLLHCSASSSAKMHNTMNRKRQPSGFATPLNHTSNAHPVERLAALIDEDVGGLDPVRLLLPQELETVHLIALQVVNTIGATLEPADDDDAQRLLAATRRSMPV
jgi:hypothetical protein